jgi:broad specificity phosphatase PhoE
VTCTVLWARHGQNVANLTGTFSHRVFDGELTPAGRRQAQDLGDLLAAADGPISLLVCSPLRRARQTADIVGQRLGLPVAMELDDLRELNVGVLDGRGDAAAWACYEQVLAAWRAGDNLPTGWVAALQVEPGAGPHASVRLLGWPPAAPG